MFGGKLTGLRNVPKSSKCVIDGGKFLSERLYGSSKMMFKLVREEGSDLSECEYSLTHKFRHVRD